MKTVRDLKIETFKSHQALGTLVAIEGENNLPIQLRRVFFVYGTEGDTLRGDHAHKECAQVLVCVNGTCEVVCDDGSETRTFTLDAANRFLHIPPGIWASERYADSKTVLLVFADKSYDPEDYIRDYSSFTRWRKKAA